MVHACAPPVTVIGQPIVHVVAAAAARTEMPLPPIVAVAPLPAVNANELPPRVAASSTRPSNAAAVPAGSSAAVPPVANVASRSPAVTSGADSLSQLASVDVRLSVPAPLHVSMLSGPLTTTTVPAPSIHAARRVSFAPSDE